MPRTAPRALPDPVRLLRRHRRLLAAALTFVAVLGSLTVLAPAAPPRSPVILATEDLSAGTRVEARHLSVQQAPLDLVPTGAATSPDAVVGRTLAGPVSAGSILTAASVAEDTRLAQPGHVIVSIPLRDEALASLAKPGTRLDLWDAAGAVVASDVRVVAAAPVKDSFAGASQGATLLEVTPAVATRLATLPPGDLTVAVR